MNILADANIFLAVILNEPEKKRIIECTLGAELISPEILPYEIGNALSAMLKQQRLNKPQIFKCWKIFEKIPVRLVSVSIEKALEIAVNHSLYAYDAYYLCAAQKYNLQVLTLDRKMKDAAGKMFIPTLEVS